MYVKALRFSSLLLLLVMLSASVESSRRVVNETSVEEKRRVARLAVFDDTWQAIDERYYDLDFHGTNWERLRSEFRFLAEAATTDAELYLVLRRLVARLDDSHTRVYAPDERADPLRPQFVSVGVGVRIVEGVAVVTSVRRDSEAKRQGVRIGDSIISVDGAAWQDIFDQRLREPVSASTDAIRREQAMSRLFNGAPGSEVTIVFARNPEATKRRRQVRLTRRLMQGELTSTVTRLRDGIYRAELNGFTPDIAATFARSLRGELREAVALVLDLRNNGGGDLEAMLDVLSVFLPPDERIGRFTDRRGQVEIEPRTRATMLTAAEHITQFRSPVVVLTSVRTASAAEVFAAAMQEHGRASIVGERTCGCVLANRRRHTLPDGGTLDISELDYRTLRGTRLEGTGITPDASLSLRRKDLIQRRDAFVEQALKEIMNAAR